MFDRVTEHRRPGIVILDRKQGQCHIIDITVPADKWVVKKEKEKVEKYQERRCELARLWSVRVAATPVVIGILGAGVKELIRVSTED